jgi:hypothetical protein
MKRARINVEAISQKPQIYQGLHADPAGIA